MCGRFTSNHHLIIVLYVRGVFEAKMQCMRSPRQGVVFYKVNDKIISVLSIYAANLPH